MPAILPTVKIDADSTLAEYFTPYQVAWIEAEDPLHARHQPVFALAEKSVRIGWTYADAFKNVRKRLRFKNRDYLFATKDWPSALEYMNLVYQFFLVLALVPALVLVSGVSSRKGGHPVVPSRQSRPGGQSEGQCWREHKVNPVNKVNKGQSAGQGRREHKRPNMPEILCRNSCCNALSVCYIPRSVCPAGHERAARFFTRNADD